MNCQPIFVTCPAREKQLAATLSHFSAVWRERPLIQVDTSVAPDPRDRQTENFRRALELFLDNGACPIALIMEDDLEFNQHLEWNLERWTPLTEGRLGFGSLYNPNVRALQSAEDHFVADPEACYGSQAYVLTRAAAQCVVRGWESVSGMQDIKTTRILAAAGYPLFYHTPSLVQHVGSQSVWGGSFHQASDYSARWKASFDFQRIPGWFTFPSLYLNAVERAREGETLVEIGAWLGKSTAFLAQAARASGKKLKVMVVDTFKGSDNEPSLLQAVHGAGGSVRPLFEQNMALADVREQIVVKEKDSIAAAQDLPDRSCGFVFIDADHRYEAVRNDIRAWLPKVASGGILAGHDCYTYAEVFNAVKDELGSTVVMTDENVWIHHVS